MTTRQQLEQQLVAAHRTGNVQAAQQAAYAIRQYDQSALSAQVPSINAPPPIERVPKPTFGSWLENVGIGIGEGLGEQVQGIGDLAQRGVSALGAYAKDPLKASAAAFMGALAPAMRGFTQPAQVAKDVGAGVVETGKQMYQQATSGPVGLGTVIGQNIDIMPGPDLPGGKRRPTMAELDVYHGTPHTFEPEEGAPLGRFRSSKIGTGEGAQAYGYGLYLAEDPDVADAYRVNLSYDPEKMRIGGKQINEVYSAIERNAARMPPNKAGIEYEKMQLLEQLMMNDSLNKVAKRASEMSPEAAQWFEKQVKPTFETYGRNYKVDLPDAKIEQMLDWDKPLSQQSDYVLERLGFHNKPRDFEAEARAIPGTPEYARLEELMNTQVGGARVPDMTGEEYYRLGKGKDKDKSEYFRSLGIPGIKYLDAGSRDGGKGTRNFVVFPGEEQNLTILERDGVKAEVPKPAAPKPTTWQGMSRDEFLGNPKITTNRNAADLKPRALTTVVTEQPKPFKGNLTIRMNEDGAAVYDGDKVIASYNFGDTLVVDKKYRKQGIGEELVYQWRKANPTAPPATERTKASQAIQEKVWQRLLNEQG